MTRKVVFKKSAELGVVIFPGTLFLMKELLKAYLHTIFLFLFRVSFGMVSNAHVMLFPYFLYPGKDLASTLSIFMIVAISLER